MIRMRVIRINHVAIRETAEDAVVISKMLYASHYFWTGIEIRALVPDRDHYVATIGPKPVPRGCGEPHYACA